MPAQSAFRGAAGYSKRAALAISEADLAKLGVRHAAISGLQNTLYRAFARTGKILTWDAMAAIERQALIGAGMEAEKARVTVSEAIKALKATGVTGPTRIPWGGL